MEKPEQTGPSFLAHWKGLTVSGMGGATPMILSVGAFFVIAMAVLALLGGIDEWLLAGLALVAFTMFSGLTFFIVRTVYPKPVQ